MSVSETETAFTYSSLTIPEAALSSARQVLYGAEGPGYVVYRGFLEPAHVEHMRRLWSGLDPAIGFQPFPGKASIRFGCPNYVVADAEGNRSFYNFFWNPPVDEVAFEVAIAVTMLRNRISGRAPHAELLPFAGKSVAYRVLLSRKAETWIAPHRDYFDHARRFEKNRFDLSRLQATLFLAKKGVDYDGVGFRFERNDGTRIVFGDDVPIEPGDLVVWRYNNEHSVERISTVDGQLGFMRLIFPPEDMGAPPAPPPLSIPARLRARLRALMPV